MFRDVDEDIIGGWIRDDRAVLQNYTPEADGEELARRFEEGTRGFGRRLQGFEPHYEGSPVVLGPPGGVTSAHGSHVFAARPGHHLSPQPFSAGGREAYQARLLLVRPDQFVKWVGDRAPGDAGALLRQVTGRS